MKNIFILFILLIGILFSKQSQSQDFKAELIGIDYYSESVICENLPILVRIKFKVSNTSAKELKIQIKYPDNITYTGAVKEIDDQGNIAYSYCTDGKEDLEFIVLFTKSNGDRSNSIYVKSNLSNAAITESIPPILQKLSN